MLTQKIKKMISVLLMAVVALSLIACGKEELIESEPQMEFAEHQMSVYLIDNWREDNAEDAASKYHTTMLVNSETFFAEPTVDDIEYLVGTEYRKLADEVDIIESNVYQMADGEKQGITTYIHFVTNELIDLKKVFVTVRGSINKENIGLSRKEYESKVGNLNGFVEIASGIEERDVPLSKILPLQNKIDENVIVLWDENESKFYFKNDPKAMCLDTNAAYMMLEVDALTNSDLSILADAFNKEGKIGDYKDGKFVEWEDNDTFKIFSRIDGEYVSVGYNVESLAEHDVIPTAISLTSNGHEYIIRMFE